MSKNKKWKRKAKRSFGIMLKLGVNKGTYQCPICHHVLKFKCSHFDSNCPNFKLVGIRQLEKEFKKQNNNK